MHNFARIEYPETLKILLCYNVSIKIHLKKYLVGGNFVWTFLVDGMRAKLTLQHFNDAARVCSLKIKKTGLHNIPDCVNRPFQCYNMLILTAELRYKLHAGIGQLLCVLFNSTFIPMI